MNPTLKSLLCAIAAVSTFFFVYWIPGSFLRVALPGEGSRWVVVALSVVAGALVAVLLWKLLGSASNGALSETAKWAAIVGGIGFLLGFFGPMLLFPGANQGPLLGLFITGPGGIVLGGLGGFFKWYLRDRETSV